jgi:hypothetical protein
MEGTLSPPSQLITFAIFMTLVVLVGYSINETINCTKVMTEKRGTNNNEHWRTFT